MQKKGPREKLLTQGAHSLSDAELIAIFLRTGTQHCQVLELAQELLKKYKNMRALFQTPLHELQQIKGIGLAKYAQLQAALELAKRYFTECITYQDTLKNPQATKSFLKYKLYQHQQEVFAAIFLNSQNQIISFEELFYGNLTITAIHPGVLLKRALHHNAKGIILAHNHPSGHCEPSEADVKTTALLKESLALVDINLLDHMVVGHEVVSLLERGLL